MSLEMGNVMWAYLGYCSFCSKNFHPNVSFESPDNSRISEEAFILCLYPPIIRIPFPVGEGIMVDPHSIYGSLGPKKPKKYNLQIKNKSQFTNYKLKFAIYKSQFTYYN